MQTLWFRPIPNNQQRITLLSQTLQAIWVASKVCITFEDTFNSFILWQSRPKMGGGMPTYNHHISIKKKKKSFRHSYDSLTTAIKHTNDYIYPFTTEKPTTTCDVAGATLMGDELVLTWEAIMLCLFLYGLCVEEVQYQSNKFNTKYMNLAK